MNERDDMNETGDAEAIDEGRLRELRAAVAALPREVAPPPEVWDAVRARLAPRGGVAPLPARPVWRHPALLAAGVVALMALSSLATLLVTGRGAKAKAVAHVQTPAASGSAPTVVPAALRAVDAGHADAVRELERALADRRASLAPETVAAVERSLRVVDDALAEARAALARDPGNADLPELVAAAYRQKLTILRRATELAARS